jgi:signal transduction histidine kinase
MTVPDDDPTLALSGDSAMVLLVDDQPIIGEAVRRMLLQERGIAFHFCSSPLDAIDAANVILPTVILQDLVMPGVDGLELLRRFRSNRQTAETPIVVLSSKEDANVKREAFSAGANDYLVKLPDQIELVARVRYHSMACINQRRRNEIAAALRESQRALAERVIELQAALEEIEQLQRTKTDFYSMVTHDLRNPAGIVRSAAKLLLDGADDATGELSPRQRRLVQITANGSDKMLRMITDYLDYAKIDAGYLRLDRYEVDLCLVLANAVAAAEPLAELKGQRLVRTDPECAVIVKADGGKLEQVLENLLSNAIKYTGEGGRIDVALHREERRVIFRVKDSGVGIDPGNLSKLFTKYHRLPGEATRAVGGTGLGLLIAKEIVEGHGGTIHAESTGVPGEGTTFVVELPL